MSDPRLYPESDDPRVAILAAEIEREIGGTNDWPSCGQATFSAMATR